MLALVVALAAACGLAWALHSPAPTGPQYSDPTPPADQTVVPPTPAIDGRGDPLPPGAIARLGTRRFQVPTYPMQPLSVAGGKAYLVYHVEPATDRGEYRWMDAKTGKVQDTWPVPAGREPLGVSPDGRWALLGVRRVITTGERLTKEEKPDLSFTLYLYDLTLRREVKILHGKLEEGEWHVRHGRFSTDGKWLVTVGGGVRLWDLGTGKEVWAIHQRKGPGQPLDCLGFTPDKAQLILRDPDKGSIHVVDVAQGKIVHEFTPEVGDRPVGTLLAPDGTALLMNLQTPEIRAWDVTTGKELAPLTGAKKLTRVFAFAPDGKTLVSGGVDSFVLVRDWPSGKVRRQLELGRDCVQNLFVSADGKTLNVVFWWENTLHRYDLGSGKPLAVPAETHRAEVFGVVAAADGSILSLGQDSVLRTWDPTTAKQICQARLDRTPAWAPFALSPDGKQIAYADYGMVSVSIVDRETGKLLRTIATAGREIDRVIFSPDGQFLAGSGRDAKVVRVWDMKTGGEVATLAAAKGGWWSGSPDFAFSPDGKLFVATEEGCVQVRGTRNWKPCGNFAAYPSGLVFSPDGRTLACASLNSVSVWEVATWQLRATLPSKAHPSYLPLFSPDGRYLAWTNSAETIEIWDLFRNQRVAEFRGHDNRIKAMTFTRDGRRLVSASEDCTLLVWDVAGAAAVANGDPGPRRPK